MAENFDEIDVEEVQKNIAALMEKKLSNQPEVSRLQREMQELERKFRAAGAEVRRIEREQETLNAELRAQEKLLDQAKRLQLVKDEQDRIRREFDEKSAELDALTATAHWREFAFDHQIVGGKQLAIARRGILGDKRGLGKTLSSLIYLDMLQAKKVLVIAPNDVVRQFQGEIHHWAPQRTIMPLSGMPPAQRNFVYPMMVNMDQFVATINYEAWRRDKTIVDDMVKIGFDTIICDEAHRIKASTKLTARGVFQVAFRPNYCMECDEIDNFAGPWHNGKILKDENVNTLTHYHEKCGTMLSSTVRNVLPMTGTPFLNKPQELFSLLFLIDPLKWPSEKKFLNDYCYHIGGGKWRFYEGGLNKLTQFMSEFFLQRTRDDAGIKIPPPAITVHEIEKDFAKYQEQYDAEANITNLGQMILKDGTQKDMFYLLELILRERQCMIWPAGIRITDPETKELLCHFDVRQSQKLDEATELLRELMEEGERVIVFSQFKPPLYEMKSRIEEDGYKATTATGDDGTWHRDQVIADFDLKTAPENPRWQVCFATYKAFGTGVNLNAARHMILLDDEWNPGMEDQAIGRIDRLNSEDQANVHIFRVKESIDDFMAAILEEKKGMTGQFESAPAFDKLKRFFTKEEE